MLKDNIISIDAARLKRQTITFDCVLDFFYLKEIFPLSVNDTLEILSDDAVILSTVIINQKTKKGRIELNIENPWQGTVSTYKKSFGKKEGSAFLSFAYKTLNAA